MFVGVLCSILYRMLARCDLFEKQHSVFVDSRLNSLALVEQLLSNDTFCCGSIRASKALPLEVSSAKAVKKTVAARQLETGEACK